MVKSASLNKQLTPYTYLVFGEDYNRHPHSMEHLFNQVKDKNNIIWIEVIGMRRPKLRIYDLKRTISILRKWVKLKKNKEQITVYSPVLIPFNNVLFIQKLNNFILSTKIKKIYKKHLLHPDKTILATSLPIVADIFSTTKSILKIYFSVDEFTLWPGLEHKIIKEKEQNILKKSNIVFATSKKLYAKSHQTNKNTFLLSHGVDFNHFNMARSSNYKKNEICYFGLIDERCDFQLLNYICEKISNIKINIFGKIQYRPQNISKSIIFHGPVPYKKLPERIKNQHILILPYKVNELTENIDPLKIREYISTNKPIVSVNLREVQKFSQYINIVKTYDDFTSALMSKLAITEKSFKDLTSFQKRESWGQKSTYFTKKINRCLNVKN